ncbi:MAG: cell cycle transcriptional regulator TrcR, partial [Pseudomonadota bacterium]
MSENLPLMPKATAIWLIDNSTLTFKQIADFCGLHYTEIEAMADGLVDNSIMGSDPVAAGQIKLDSLRASEANPDLPLKLVVVEIVQNTSGKKKRNAKYVPRIKRQDKPDAIYWLVRNHPNMPDSKIIKLIGTTKKTIEAIRTKTHWNIKNMKARDPVILGFCSQIELDKVIDNLP